jgi:uncharacterized membrane protein
MARIAGECRGSIRRRQTARHDRSRHNRRGFTPPGRRRYASAGMIPSPAYADPPAPFGRLFFERVLLPRRSLPPRGFRLLMVILVLISLAVGIGFVSIGAWPVVGFFGLDVALVYVAFRLNYRSARRSETLRLAGDAFSVERVSVHGSRRMWRFQPFWVRVILEERPDESNRLFVASHGHSLAIGDFLPPSARRELAATIREALQHWRNSFTPTTADRSAD